MKTDIREERRYTLAMKAGVVSALALGVALVASEPTRALVQAACEASFEPSSVPAGSEAATVFYRLSEEIGSLDGVTAQDGSGLVVTGHDGEMATLSLNTTEANAGSWSVTFHGQDDQTCAGAIEVSAHGDDRA